MRMQIFRIHAFFSCGSSKTHTYLPTLQKGNNKWFVFLASQFDGDMAAILCMCLETLAVQYLQQQQQQELQQELQQQQQKQELLQHVNLPVPRWSLGHEDFMLLTSSAAVTPQDKVSFTLCTHSHLPLCVCARNLDNVAAQLKYMMFLHSFLHACVGFYC